jgi:RNA polymerase sigma factor (sigma-70 family)
MHDDAELLRQYVADRSESAFTELIQRHVDLVYSAASRLLTGDVHRAQDVSQQVFSELARQAPRLTRHPTIAGWLYTTTRLMALRAIRTEKRCKVREQEVHTMNELLSEGAPETDWQHLRPVLEEAMHDLREKDRLAVLLRFFQNKSLKEVGQALGLNENAARMRVERAIEKLRAQLERRGVTSTTTALALALAGNAINAAPPGFAATLAGATLTGLAAETATPFALLKLMAATKLQFGIVSAVLLVSVATPLVFQYETRAKLRDQTEVLRQRTEQLAALETENERLSNRVALTNPRSLPNDQFNELLRLRGEVSRLRADARELEQQRSAPLTRNDALASMAKFYAERITQLKQLLETNPSEKIPELQLLTDSEWLWLAHKGSLDTDDSVRRAMSITRTMAEGHVFHDVLKPALQQYAKDNNGQFPADIAQLKPWFKSPVDDAVLQRWVVLPKSKLAEDLQAQLGEDWFITQKAPVNAALDQRYLAGLKETHLFADGPPHWWILR